MLNKFFALSLCAGSLIAGAGEFRIEPDNIGDLKQWKFERSSKHTGYKGLWANGVKGEANRISGTYKCPETGQYYIWVRTLNRGDRYRKTEVKVNNKSIGSFGDDGVKGQKPVLGWKRTLGALQLNEGKLQVDFIPLSGHSRIDSVIFTTDQNFIPSNDRVGIEKIAEVSGDVIAFADVVKPENVIKKGVISADAVYFRIEPDSIGDLKQWKFERSNKHTEYKGLWANGVRGEANRISGTYNCPESGRYYVWVRTLNRGDRYRKTEVKVNNESIGSFGDDGVKGQEPVLGWKRTVGAVQLNEGKLQIDFIPLSDHSRIDSVIFTTDDSFVPADTKSEIEKIKEIKDANSISSLPTFGKKNNRTVLLLHGGRPWTILHARVPLATAGAFVTYLDSTNLDGLGGASIKHFLSDKVEPKANDGITPAFKNLDKFKVLFITSIPTENQAKIFTPERIDALKKYVKNGGVVIFNNQVPESLQDILPVDLSSADTLSEEDSLQVSGTRPEAKIFSFLPEKFTVFGGTTLIQPVEGADVWSSIVNSDGEKLGAFIASKNIGKGKVVYMAFNWARVTGLKQIWAWAYGKQLITAITSHAGNLNLDPGKLVDYSKVPERQPKGEISVEISEPEMALKDCDSVALNGNVATFSNGVKLTIAKDGKVAVTYPGQSENNLIYNDIPTMRFFAAMEKLTSDTAEAVDERIKYAKVTAAPWKFDGAKVDGNTLVLSFSSAKGTFDWQFKGGTLDLDGRHYDAVASRVNIKKYDGLLQAIEIDNSLKFGKTLAGHRAKRLACYAPPRGYADKDFSGKNADTTSRYMFFGNGQPFTWVVAPSGIYSSFVEAPIVTTARVDVAKNAEYINEKIILTVGRRKAPISTKYLWHSFSAGKENPRNDWMAMYQFQRKHHCQLAGLKELPAIPTASHTNGMTPEQREIALAAAQKLGFKQFHMQRCPSPIESINSPDTVEWYQRIRKYGMIPRPWTPADYTHGDGEKIHARTELFLRNADGQIFSYFGKHPVLDMANPETVKWYKQIIDDAVAGGMGAIYTDMGGALTDNINFAGEESGTGLDAIIPIYQYYHSKGIQFGIEGMTPLGLNSFWYRRHKYVPFAGNEFSLIGSQCYSDHADDIDLDYFRLAMYGSFMLTHVEGYAMNFERRPHEISALERIGKLNSQIYQALDLTVMPYIRDIGCGTTWIGENGAAVFCYDPVEKLTVKYNGKTEIYNNVPGDTVIMLKK